VYRRSARSRHVRASRSVADAAAERLQKKLRLAIAEPESRGAFAPPRAHRASRQAFTAALFTTRSANLKRLSAIAAEILPRATTTFGSSRSDSQGDARCGNIPEGRSLAKLRADTVKLQAA